MRVSSVSSLLLLWLWLWLIPVAWSVDSSSSTSTSSSIPRSSSILSRKYEQPWNPSPHIDDDGFFFRSYTRQKGEWEKELPVGGRHERLDEDTPVWIRQVPGDGNCLFHSISTCLAHAENKTHLPLDSTHGLETLYQQSRKLRQQAVHCLSQSRNPWLFLQGQEYLRAHDLVQAAAQQYSISRHQYCELMAQDSYWGGGPEIVALANVLKRPIHVYELIGVGRQFQLRRMACFGSPRFDKKEPLHILSADSRFPDIAPGKHSPNGNHFLAVFPEPTRTSRASKRYLRGGHEAEDDNENEEEGKQKHGFANRSSRRRFSFIYERR